MKFKASHFLNLFFLLLLCSTTYPQNEAEKPLIRFKDISANIGIEREWATVILQDSKGLMWYGTDYGFKSFDGYGCEEYLLTDGDILVLAMMEDHLGDIWVAANGNRVYHLHRKENRMTRYALDSTHALGPMRLIPLIGFGKTLIQDKDQNIWASTYQGIFKFDWAAERFILVQKAAEHYTGKLFEDNQQTLWEVLENGVRPFNARDRIFIPFRNGEGMLQEIDQISSIAVDQTGNLWIATTSQGVFKFDLTTKLLTQYKNDPFDPFSLSFNHINSVLADHQNRIWLAADEGGLDLFDRSTNRFHHYQANFRNSEGIHSKPVCLYEDKSNSLWVGHWHTGITYVSAFSKKFKPYSAHIGEEKSLNSPYVVDFFERPNGDIWIATDGGGLNLWHRKSDEFSHFIHDPLNPNSISSNEALSVIEDPEGFVWIATSKGVNRFDFEKGTYKTYPINGFLYRSIFLIHHNEVWVYNGVGLNRYNRILDSFELILPGFNQIFESANGAIWVLSRKEGLCRYNVEKGEIEDCVSVNLVGGLSEDSMGNLWMLLPPKGDTLIKYDPQVQEFSDTVLVFKPKSQIWNTLTVDQNDHVWIGTKNGLYCYQPETRQLNHYEDSDGLASNFLIFAPPTKTQKGELLLSSNNGFTIFHPDSIKENTFIPPVLITEFYIGNHKVPVSGTIQDTFSWESPLKEHIHLAKNIKLKHFQNDLAFEFVALDYTNPLKNKYKYKLEGYDKDWIETDASKRQARYTNLSPDTYTFRVLGSNDDDHWNYEGASLILKILPPWYWAWYTKTLYALALLALLYVFYRFQLKRQLAEAEAVRLKELNNVKTRLYTNITHEFRTPLTVISGMADQVLEHPKEWFREGLNMIKRNSQQLLTLVNHMLDLSKLESGTLPVHLIQDDMVGYLKYLSDSFHAFAETKDIRLHFLPEVEQLLMDFDPEKIQTIFSNLVGNAIKFTPVGGDVYVKIQELEQKSCCQLRIADTGVGISKEQLSKVFDRFFQADDSATRHAEGTGIGLALTKELVKLLKGKIEVKSKLGAGTEFTVLLPITNRAEKENSKATMETASRPPDLKQGANLAAIASSAKGELPLALLVEDNKDVLLYLASCLEGQYQLELAENGRIGIEKAIEMIPDIIVSDVMMPEKDGFELLATLKKDERTSHIPIILLTARADMESRLEGLEQGADAYLAKPFDKKELEVRLRKLIELRKQLQARYQSLTPNSSADNPAMEKEDAFLSKIREEVEAHLEDEDFGIVQLCRAMGTSRTQLHRKLKALTNKSTSHVIRSIRLQKAKELLQTSDLNVSEVGYAVGFSNRSHFTQVFKEEFGEAPNVFKERH